MMSCHEPLKSHLKHFEPVAQLCVIWVCPGVVGHEAIKQHPVQGFRFIDVQSCP